MTKLFLRQKCCTRQAGGRMNALNERAVYIPIEEEAEEEKEEGEGEKGRKRRRRAGKGGGKEGEGKVVVMS